MATGRRNKLTGQIGEHLVSAILGTKGYYASPYSGNVPGFDITAVNAETLDSFLIQVKTSNSQTLVHSTINKWVEHRIESGNYQRLGKPLPRPHPHIIWILVSLKDNDITTARYFICTEEQIQEKIIETYTNYMEKHNYRRPRGGASTQATLSIKDMEKFENKWSILK